MSVKYYSSISQRGEELEFFFSLSRFFGLFPTTFAHFPLPLHHFSPLLKFLRQVTVTALPSSQFAMAFLDAQFNCITAYENNQHIAINKSSHKINNF